MGIRSVDDKIGHRDDQIGGIIVLDRNFSQRLINWKWEVKFSYRNHLDIVVDKLPFIKITQAYPA